MITNIHTTTTRIIRYTNPAVHIPRFAPIHNHLDHLLYIYSIPVVSWNIPGQQAIHSNRISDTAFILDTIPHHRSIQQSCVGRGTLWKGNNYWKSIECYVFAKGALQFGSYYLKHEFYFDVHPPLGKMLVGLSGWLAGYDGSFDFESGSEYPKNVNFASMRIFNAAWGALVVPIAYLTAQQFGMSMPASLLAATMVLCGKVQLITSTRL